MWKATFIMAEFYDESHFLIEVINKTYVVLNLFF